MEIPDQTVQALADYLRTKLEVQLLAALQQAGVDAKKKAEIAAARKIKKKGKKK